MVLIKPIFKEGAGKDLVCATLSYVLHLSTEDIYGNTSLGSWKKQIIVYPEIWKDAGQS